MHYYLLHLAAAIGILERSLTMTKTMSFYIRWFLRWCQMEKKIKKSFIVASRYNHHFSAFSTRVQLVSIWTSENESYLEPGLVDWCRCRGLHGNLYIYLCIYTYSISACLNPATVGFLCLGRNQHSTVQHRPRGSLLSYHGAKVPPVVQQVDDSATKNIERMYGKPASHSSWEDIVFICNMGWVGPVYFEWFGLFGLLCLILSLLSQFLSETS